MLNPDQLIEKTKRVIDSCDNMKQFKPCIAYVRLAYKELGNVGCFTGFMNRVGDRFLHIVNNKES